MSCLVNLFGLFSTFVIVFCILSLENLLRNVKQKRLLSRFVMVIKYEDQINHDLIFLSVQLLFQE